MNADAMQEELKELFEQFTSRLPERLNEIVLLWRSSKACYTPDSLTELSHLTHKLAGSTGTYGYDSLESILSKLECDVNGVLADKTAFSSFSSAIDQGVALLEQGFNVEASKKAWALFLERNSKN